MTSISTTKWDFRNCELLPSGEIAVREYLWDVDAGVVWTKMLDMKTIVNPRTDTVLHYCLVVNTSTLMVVVYDEDWIQISSISLGAAPSDIYRAGFCVSVLGDEVIVSSPYFSTLWGFNTGGTLETAQKVDSINAANTTAIDLPVDVSVSWAGRIVWADGGAVWFSDPVAFRTVVARSAVIFPGGKADSLHVNAGGALILCSEGGVFALSEQAAATGQIVVGIFQKLSDHRTVGYDQTCICNGRVYGLTERGFSAIDAENQKEYHLSEASIRRTTTPRFAFADYRQGKMFATPTGPAVNIGRFVHFTNIAAGFSTWWTTSDPLSNLIDIRAVGYEKDGEMFFMNVSSPVWRHGDLSLTEGAISAEVAGSVKTPSGESVVVRRAFFQSDSQEAFGMSFMGEDKTSSAQIGRAHV